MMFRRKTSVRYSLLIVLLATYTLGNAESLGRLFFTPQERAALDRARTGNDNFQEAESANVRKAPATINGYIERSDGKSTIWLDRKPQYRTFRQIDSAAVGADSRIVVRRASPRTEKDQREP